MIDALRFDKSIYYVYADYVYVVFAWKYQHVSVWEW